MLELLFHLANELSQLFVVHRNHLDLQLLLCDWLKSNKEALLLVEDDFVCLHRHYLELVAVVGVVF